MVSTTEEATTVVPVEQVEQQTIGEEDFDKAQKLFQLGKKNLFLNKFDESVNNIGDACKVYATKFGEMDPQCAEVYFFYGRALFELARIENTVLGNALSGVPEETGAIDDSRYGNPEDVAVEEKNEISEKVIDALCTSEEQPSESKNVEETAIPATTEQTPVSNTDDSVALRPSEEQPSESKNSEETAIPATTEETPVSNTEDSATAVANEEEEESEDEEEDVAEDENKEDTEDISNLERAWEMFELAKVIYTKNYDNDPLFKSKRIAECLIKLGEISIEQEIYEQAIVDISESIRIQEEFQPADRDERMLAESYYQLGLARQFNNQFTDANEAYQRSINIIQLRIDKLKARLSDLGECDDSERTTINDEITELEALLPEMTSKLEEVSEQGQQALNLIKEAKECFATTTPPIETKLNNSQGNGDVKDITSLVKSKRTNDGEDLNTVKKIRLSSEGVENLEQPSEQIEINGAEA